MFSIYLFFSFLFGEILAHIFCRIPFSGSFLLSIIYIIAISALLSFFSSLAKNRVKTIIQAITVFIIIFFYGMEICYYRILGVYFSFESILLADQIAGSFLNEALTNVFIDNIAVIILVFIPFITFFFLRKYLSRDFDGKKKVIYLLIFVLGISLIQAYFHLGENSSLKESYLKKQNNDLNIENFGMMPAALIELRKSATGFEEELIISDIPQDVQEEIEEPSYKAQILDIDFDKLSENTSNRTLLNMNEYFKNESPTYTNEYTSFFEGKNLILFMAESFSGYAVDKDLTPTLYKLVNNGFHFTNFYTPTILSTIGGEFQELTGLYPVLRCLSYYWRKGSNYYPYGLATVFKEKEYTTYAYHNSSYTFQDRNVYLKSLGFDNFLAGGNGLQERMSCKWPAEDSEMIDVTYEDYISDEHFFAYYVTVSGHKSYSMSSRFGKKYKDLLNDLDYSSTVKAYIATQIELDRALESLLNHLSENGRLEDTVIALVADHYPYGLTSEQMSELAGKEIDSTIEINRNSFILYNAAMETTTIDKVASSIDVLPTMLNLFGIEYDSRLIIGKDLLAPGEGLAMFGDRSWVSDSGVYYAKKHRFYANKELNNEEEYVSFMNDRVANRILMSEDIMEQDYYSYVFGK